MAAAVVQCCFTAASSPSPSLSPPSLALSSLLRLSISSTLQDCPSSMKHRVRVNSSRPSFSINSTTGSRNSTRRSVSKSPSAKYISEDYLVKKVSAKQVQELVKGERSVPLIVDFYATWCGPCILMAQELEMLAVEYESNALFVKVDTDDEYEFARDMQVRGLPTLYFISPDPSKDAIRTEGLVPSEMIKNIIDNEM